MLLNKEGPFQIILMDQEWTTLSGTIAAYNKRPIKPGGNVYIAELKYSHGKTKGVAVKLILRTKRNIEEIDVLQKLRRHPNVVKIFEAGECKGASQYLYIAMEHCDQNLSDFIQINPFRFHITASLFQQIVAALAYIHRNNISHGNLKPTNILVSYDGTTAKVCDFGITEELFDNGCAVSGVQMDISTLGFRPPEMYKTGKEASYMGDIYSLAIITYIIYTHGQHPFGCNPVERPGNIIANKACDLSMIPPFPETTTCKRSQLLKLLQQMLEPSPQDRPTAQQVQENIFFEDPLKIRIKQLEERSLHLSQSSKYQEAVEVLHELNDLEGFRRVKTHLKIAECELQLKRGKGLEAMKKVKGKISKSCSSREVMGIAHRLYIDGLNIQALIMYRVANELHAVDTSTSSDVTNWIIDCLINISCAIRPLIASDSATRNIAIEYGMKYMEMLYEDLRKVENVVPEPLAHCQVEISLLYIVTGECEKAILICEDGISNLERQSPENAVTCEHYGRLLNNLGVALGQLGCYFEAGPFYARALEAKKRANYRSECNRQKSIATTQVNLSRNWRRLTASRLNRKGEQ